MNTIEDYIKNGYIKVQKHPEADLYIYNYTAQAQYEGMWNEITLSHRGLIKDGKGNIVARPFEKFFNMQEVEKLPDGVPILKEKLDGSLGISYMVNGELRLATRGSFTSKQAIKGTALLRNYPKLMHTIYDSPQFTFLFEIIYPENRIVVDYEGREELVLLAVRNIHTGEYIDPDRYELFIDCPIAKSYDISVVTPENLEAYDNGNSEGYVIEFVNDGEITGRVKFKFEEYKRLHKILTEFSTIGIWEALQEGTLNQYLEKVPDEFYAWVREVEKDILEKYKEIEDQAILIRASVSLLSRKEQGMYLQKNHPDVLSIVFAMIDKKDYSHIIWKKVKPKQE